jgi:hypothetical protein
MRSRRWPPGRAERTWNHNSLWNDVVLHSIDQMAWSRQTGAAAWGLLTDVAHVMSKCKPNRVTMLPDERRKMLPHAVLYEASLLARRCIPDEIIPSMCDRIPDRLKSDSSGTPEHISRNLIRDQEEMQCFCRELRSERTRGLRIFCRCPASRDCSQS